MKLRRLHNPRGWTSLPNALLEDRSMSWRARGILAYLLSRPDGWETDSVRLAALAGEVGERRSRRAEGRDAVRSALEEIERAKYLHRVRVQGPGGRWSTEYYVFDHPTEQAMPAALGGQNPLVETPVDNPVENSAPTPDYQASVNPASITSTDEQIIHSSGGDLSRKNESLWKTDAGDAGALSLELAARADEVPAPPALTSTDAIAEVSRLEPGIQMFALRAHLMAELGYQPTFAELGDLVLDAHYAAPPSLRGRLRDRDVVGWIREFAPEHSSGSASVEASGSAAHPQRALAGAEPALRAGGSDESQVADSTTHVNH